MLLGDSVDRWSWGRNVGQRKLSGKDFSRECVKVKGKPGVWRVKWAAFSTVLLFAACNGFPNPAPIREAEHRPEKYPTYLMDPTQPFLQVGEQRWVVQPGAVARVPGDMLTPVPQSSLLALKWEHPPLSALFQREPNGTLLAAGEVR